MLFEVEQSNLFRDPLVDAEHASILLAKHSFSAASSGPQRAVIEALQHKAENILATARDFAPIDDAWESRRVLLQRLEIQRSALAGPSTTKEMKDD